MGRRGEEEQRGRESKHDDTCRLFWFPKREHLHKFDTWAGRRQRQGGKLPTFLGITLHRVFTAGIHKLFTSVFVQLVKGSIAETNRLETKRSVSIIHHHNRCKLSITMGWSNIDGYSWQTRPSQQQRCASQYLTLSSSYVLPCLACNTLAQLSSTAAREPTKSHSIDTVLELVLVLGQLRERFFSKLQPRLVFVWH